MIIGCADVAETGQSEQETNTSCPPWTCLNSPETLLHNMHELHLFKERNAQGLHLEYSQETGRASIFVGGVPYELHVDRNRFVAVRKEKKLVGNQLIGARLHVMKDKDRLYDIVIRAVRETSFPVGDDDKLELYELVFGFPGGSEGKHLCNGGVAVEEFELLGMGKDEVLIFTGDRINADALTIEKDPSENWINFGCAGHTLAKLHLTRNTTSSNQGKDPLGSQATLKMMAGDYCGTGDPITVSGTPVRWQGGLVKYGTYGASPGVLEARWTHKGATCVNTLRLLQSPATAFPNPWASLLLHCSPPSCQNSNPYDMGKSLRVSALPL